MSDTPSEPVGAAPPPGPPPEAAGPAPGAPDATGAPPPRRRSDRLQLVAGLLGALVTLLASGGALAGGDHRRVVLLTFGAGLAMALFSAVKYRRAIRAPRPPAD